MDSSNSLTSVPRDFLEIDLSNSRPFYGGRLTLGLGYHSKDRTSEKASESDVEFANGQFTVAGTDKSVAWGDVCLAAYVPHNYPLEDIEPGLEETSFYDPANFTYPSGGYACEVEVDPDTGRVTVERFAAADDFGNIVNPMIVTGQVHGGLGQGIGQAHHLDGAGAMGQTADKTALFQRCNQAVNARFRAQIQRLFHFIKAGRHTIALHPIVDKIRNTLG